jgi:hypothetical protein
MVVGGHRWGQPLHDHRRLDRAIWPTSTRPYGSSSSLPGRRGVATGTECVADSGYLLAPVDATSGPPLHHAAVVILLAALRRTHLPASPAPGSTSDNAPIRTCGAIVNPRGGRVFAYCRGGFSDVFLSRRCEPRRARPGTRRARVGNHLVSDAVTPLSAEADDARIRRRLSRKGVRKA